MSDQKKIVIIGGGLAGLIAGIRLARKGVDCTLIEKKAYPFHRVCGEYISNETEDFLQREGLYPETFNPPKINQLQLSSVSGKDISLPLTLGGFGISRYAYDNFLYGVAKQSGVKFLLQTEVRSATLNNSRFEISTDQQTLEADFLIGAFGKRSRLDVQLSRPFVKKRSPYVGVKYHLRTDQAIHRISLHNFAGGYCGVSNIEDGKTNMCYLTHRDNIKRFGGIEEMEKNILFRNPYLKSLFQNSEFLFQKPEVINEISFETKEPIYNHILMIGDTAGMITPLCGNGMAMAIHSAKILSDLMGEHIGREKVDREVMEKEYKRAWKKIFSKRLWVGRQVQNKLFGKEWSSAFAINLAVHSPRVARLIVKSTHGEPF